ncbi:hypothetical protein [Arthrobacter sp. ES1]|uniref:hypothetical protein n=1 Tax=Arthrobacter sp. ES1 TaxID=1897056 RepID=UPI001CFFC3A4|nr:hypothetical protein [Arthrobacter sp. ES1]MCB5280641.1 hypothetical protein [Arthrobacter sp. ES1]
MALTITNQKPAQFSPVHTLPVSGVYDPVAGITATLVEPLYTPLNQTHPVTITDAGGNDLDQDATTQLFLDCLGDSVDAQAEDTVKNLVAQGSIYYDQKSPLLVNELFAVQAGVQYKLPTPTATCIYTAQSDVIPAAKKLLAGQVNDAGELFASIAYAFHPETLGVWFQSSAAFDDFKTWLTNTTATLSSVLPPETTNLLTQFSAITLKDLTESLLLRKDDADENEEYSFARVIIHMLMDYVHQQETAAAAAQTVPETGVMPFLLSELYSPRTLVIVNVEAHARATGNKVTSEWKMINSSIASPVKVLSNKSISKLTALPRAAAKAAHAASAMAKSQQQTGRSAKVTFRKQAPSKVDLVKDLTRVLKRMGQVNRSQNVFRQVKSTFVKANRRDPDDWNKPGRIVSTRYMPDLHVYIDTSGSISEKHYQQSVIMLISMAKKLNVDLYFNSFSHVLSQEVLLRTANKSVAQIWNEFRKIPKVNGGTEYKQIWDYINASPARKRRLSLVITDFEWYPPTTREEHPKNLYYAPCSSMDWGTITRYARKFVTGMRHIEPAMAQRMLGLIN